MLMTLCWWIANLIVRNGKMIVLEMIERMDVESDQILDSSGGALRQFLRRLHGFFVSLTVDREAAFLGHQLRQVDGEAVSVVHPPGHVTGKDSLTEG